MVQLPAVTFNVVYEGPDSVVAFSKPGHVDKVTTKKTVKQLPAEFYTPFLSDLAKNRRPSPIRSLFPLEGTPGMITMLAGKPNSAMYPFDSVEFTTNAPEDPSRKISLSVDSGLLSQGLQYAGTDGIPPFLDWLTMLQEREHGRSGVAEGWCVTATTGSQDGLYKAAHAIFNPGDAILVEKPVYAGVIPIFHSLNLEVIEVETDSQGVRSDSLRSILERWPVSRQKPKALYTVPYGGNPTGMTASLQRRREVFALAQTHNFIILEDDPYYYLYYGAAQRPPSYFTLEAKTGEVGRVLRFDSFSKILSAGIRIGFATGPTPLITAINMHTASANLQPCTFVQSVVLTLLNSWGFEGFKHHTRTAAAFYKQKRDAFERAMRKHMNGLAEWTTPEAGMFFWIKLLVNSSDADDDGDSSDLVRIKAYERGVLVLPGTEFLASGAKTAYVRASFSLLKEADMDEAVRRLRNAVLGTREEARE